MHGITLQPQRSLQTLQVALFYKSYQGLIRKLSSSHPPTLDSEGRGESYGINLIYTGKIQMLSYTLSYGFTEAKLSYNRFTHRVRPDYLSPHAAKASLRAIGLAPFRQ